MATFEESRYGRFKPRKNQLPPEFLPLLPFPGLSTSDETRELSLSSAMSKGAEIAGRELAKELAKKKLWIRPNPFVMRLPTTPVTSESLEFSKNTNAERNVLEDIPPFRPFRRFACETRNRRSRVFRLFEWNVDDRFDRLTCPLPIWKIRSIRSSRLCHFYALDVKTI